MATQDILIGYAKIWYAPVGEAFPMRHPWPTAA